ncbi:MAG: carboxypeptidase M32 [Planctomycetes bacterium]|nr:carboxypeptidase M32 [Planctomycetota bacterium]MBL7042865.1 carboxypeptidase M32 [Pirellulaceae bacterium]
MSDTANTAFEQLCQFSRQTATLQSIEELLGWDERTMLPPSGGEFRAEQITCLSGLVHRRRTDPQVGRWLEELVDSPLAADPHSDTGATIRQIKRGYEKHIKLPQSLVEELARTAVLGQQAWTEARKNDNFASFQPLLERTYELKRRQAEAIGYATNPYDALLDDYEPDAKTADVQEVLTGLREQLAPFVAAIADSGRQANVEILRRNYPIDVQEAFGKQVAAAIGFDFQRGRLDVTHHPFCAGLGPDDCRITTRYDERNFPSAFFGILHEAGHGLYEQGLRKDQFGLPPGCYVSLGIHESQSRMWENAVGRSHAFWQYVFPQARKSFPGALPDVTLDEFYFAINDVRPSLIRVEADEATYNLHIVIRFELEQALLAGDLAVADLPGAWNDKYRDYLGIEPPHDADGVLQDIHWSAGLVGYFPTYSLGNLYAAQFFAQADLDLGDLDGQLARGEFAPLREWLCQKIHRQGECYTPSELVQRITGRPLSHEPLMDYLRGKLEPLYGI